VVALVNISTEKWPRRGIAPLWISDVDIRKEALDTASYKLYYVN
jgi:hypothetical protein